MIAAWQMQERKWQYILGVRMRSSKEAREEVMGRAGRYHEVHARSTDPHAPAPLKVKEVWVEDRRYVVCHNQDQAEKDRQERAPAPFTTSTMQQQANIRLRFTADRTMRAAQRLYEGVDLGSDGSVALITYMRTDSTRVSNEALKAVRGHI